MDPTQDPNSPQSTQNFNYDNIGLLPPVTAPTAGTSPGLMPQGPAMPGPSPAAAPAAAPAGPSTAHQIGQALTNGANAFANAQKAAGPMGGAPPIPKATPASPQQIAGNAGGLMGGHFGSPGPVIPSAAPGMMGGLPGVGGGVPGLNARAQQMGLWGGGGGGQ